MHAVSMARFGNSRRGIALNVALALVAFAFGYASPGGDIDLDFVYMARYRLTTQGTGVLFWTSFVLV